MLAGNRAAPCQHLRKKIIQRGIDLPLHPRICMIIGRHDMVWMLPSPA